MRSPIAPPTGTKKKQRAMRSQEDNRIKAEGVVGSQALSAFLTDTVQAAVAEDRREHKSSPSSSPGGKAQKGGASASQAAADATRALLLPPFDAEATTPGEAYRVRDMIGPEEWEALEGQLERVEAAAEDSASFVNLMLDEHRTWPAFVRSRMTAATGLGEEVGRARVCALLYLRHLFQLHRATYSLRGTRAHMSRYLDVPEAIVEKLLQRFAELQGVRQGGDEGGGQGQGQGQGPVQVYSRTKALRDKLLCHIAVLSLLVQDDFCVAVGDVATDLRMSTKECVQFYLEVRRGLVMIHA
jgi:hypothetical protein